MLRCRTVVRGFIGAGGGAGQGGAGQGGALQIELVVGHCRHGGVQRLDHVRGDFAQSLKVGLALRVVTRLG